MILRFFGFMYSDYCLEKKLEERLLKSYFPEYPQMIKFMKNMGRKKGRIDKTHRFNIFRKVEKIENKKQARYMNGDPRRA